MSYKIKIILFISLLIIYFLNLDFLLSNSKILRNSEFDNKIMFPLNKNYMFSSIKDIKFKNDEIYFATWGEGVYKSILNEEDLVPINNGLFTHFINKIIFDQEDPNKIFLATDIGIYKSINNGKNWFFLSELPDVVNTFIFDLKNKDKIFAGCNKYGLYLSTNEGKDWIYIDIDKNLSKDNENIYFIEQDSKNENNLYIATSNGIYKSEDGGLTWKIFGFNNECSTVIKIIYDDSIRKLYVGTVHGLFVSYDDGKNWSPIFRSLKSGVSCLNILNKKNIFFGTNIGEIYKYDEEAKLLEKLNLDSEYINCIEFNNNIMYIGLNENYAISKNFGKTFLKFEEPKQILYTKKINNTEFSCTSFGLYKKINNKVWVKIGFDNFIVNYIKEDPNNYNIFYVATNNGLYKTDDFGESFHEVNIDINTKLDIEKIEIAKLKDQDLTYIFLSSFSGFYKSIYSENLNFKKTFNGIVICFEINLKNPSIIYLGGRGLFKSTDAGDTWENIGLTYYYIYSIGIDPNNNKKLFVGTSNYGLFKTDNDGITWERAFIFDSEYYTFKNIFIHPNNNNIIYTFGILNIPLVNKQRGFCFYTNDCFINWYELELPLTIENINSYFFESPDVLILSTEIGNFYLNISNNSGYFNSVNTSLYISNTLEFDNKLYYIGRDGKIGYFDNIRRSFLYNYPLDLEIYCIHLNPLNENTIYLGTNFGLFNFDLKNLKYIETNETTNFRSSINSIFIDKNDSFRIFLSTNEGIFMSDINKYKWINIGLNELKINSFSCINFEDKKLYFAATNNGLYITKDLKVWEKLFDIHNYVDTKAIGSNIYILNFINNKIYIGTDNGVYESEDIGKNWRFLGLENSKVFKIYQYNNGILTSGDSGINYYDFINKIWIPLSNGLTNYFLNDLYIDNKNNVYVGTDGNGIFKLIKIYTEKPSIIFNYEFMEKFVKIKWNILDFEISYIRKYELYRGNTLEEMKLIKVFNNNSFEYLDNEISSNNVYYYQLKIVGFYFTEISEILIIQIPIQDSNPPYIEIIFPNDNYYTNNYQINIIGKVYDHETNVKDIYINDNKINFNITGLFNFNLNLNEGINKIFIKAYDTFNNFAIKEINVILDLEKPELILNIPDRVYNDTLIINGKIKDNYKFIKYLKLNDNILNLTENFEFYQIIYLKEGINYLNFKYEDIAGNLGEKSFKVLYLKIIKFELTINSDIMYVNDTPKKIDTPPRIIEGRTYLPIRYILEPLGAKLIWEQNERKVKILFNDIIIELWIDKNLAKVNNNIKLIDPENPKVTPLIINGRTMLPIRFVAENLGCKVNWDSINKKISIIYPGDL
ncbi:MAG: stalk domain-containing protein [Caldisericia bacterium]|nr:stalk domain-containing protein [Caldisericia bacterium]